MLLEGRVGIVSGIGPGVGREVALAFAREGAHVVLAARTESALETVAQEVRALGREAFPVRTDIASAHGCTRLVERTVER
jgi:NAD(P)-dependent dehydrogenase (short-subunit alcohol dehydrogenase family)